jgi:hypothetical protein
MVELDVLWHFPIQRDRWPFPSSNVIIWLVIFSTVATLAPVWLVLCLSHSHIYRVTTRVLRAFARFFFFFFVVGRRGGKRTVWNSNGSLVQCRTRYVLFRTGGSVTQHRFVPVINSDRDPLLLLMGMNSVSWTDTVARNSVLWNGEQWKRRRGLTKWTFWYTAIKI